MATIDQGATAPSLSLPDDLIVEIQDGLGFAEFHGTRAMLEAEGVIPLGTKWPDSFDDLCWQSGQFDYWLKRWRPPGAKGPRSAFAEVDWFFLRWELTHKPSHESRAVDRKKQELKDAIYRQSAEGRAEWNKQWNDYWKAKNDEKFQAFKAHIPGIIQPKRGCRRKKVEQSKGELA